MRQDRSFRDAGSGLISTAFAPLSNYDALFFAALLFLAPNFIFAARALQPAPAALVLAGCVGVVAFLWRSRPGGAFLSAPLEPRKFGLCLALGLALCLLGGEGHLFFANWDWLTRDAVLSDLVHENGVPLYRYLGYDFYLRSPLGMYLLPAAVGRVFGFFAAHLALLTMNAVLFGAILYLSSGLAGGRAPIFLAILIGFGGLDIVGDLAARMFFSRSGPITNQSLEWWAAAFAPGVMLQYSSMLTQLFWVPNHAAPGWFIGLLVLLQGRGEIALSTLIVCCASLVFWSPFPVAGALPLAAALASRSSLRSNFSTENLLAAVTGLAFLPLALYLLTWVDAIPHGSQFAVRGFAWIAVLFLLIELPQVVVLLLTWRRLPLSDRPSLIAALLTLCLLPLYSFGPGNDLLMRGSIPALFLVAFSFARIAAMTPRDGGVLATAISAIVLISALTPATQIKQAIVSGRYSLSDCNLLTASLSASPMDFPANYLALVEAMPSWLVFVDSRRAPMQVEYRDCWPAHPFRDLMRRDLSD